MPTGRAAAVLSLLLVAPAAPAAAQAPDATSPALLPWSQQIAVREGWVQQRHAALLPMLRRHGIAMWIIATEEFHEDPLVAHVAPPRPYVGNRDFFVFVDAGDAGLRKIAITGYTEDNLRQFFETGEPVPAEVRLKQLVDEFTPKTIGLSIGGTRGMTRSLTHDTYRMITGAIGTPAGVSIVSAQDLIEEYADTRLPDEMPHYTTAVALTEALTRRALSSEVITPGTTTVGDVRRWLYDALWAHGVRTWFQPDLRVQRQGASSATSRGFLAVAPEATVITRGDVVHVDFGLSYMGFDTDWQKMAYVLREGETDAPAGLKQALANANTMQDITLEELRSGRTGNEVLKSMRMRMAAAKIEGTQYSHPIGLHGHGAGPLIGLWDYQEGVPGRGDARVIPSMWFSIELQATTPVPEWDGQKVRMAQEEDVVIDAAGKVRWALKRQDRLFLVR